MAAGANWHLSVQMDPEKVEAHEEAVERFSKASIELREAAQAVQESMYDLRNSLSVSKTEEDG